MGREGSSKRGKGRTSVGSCWEEGRKRKEKKISRTVFHGKELSD